MPKEKNICLIILFIPCIPSRRYMYGEEIDYPIGTSRNKHVSVLPTTGIKKG